MFIFNLCIAAFFVLSSLLIILFNSVLVLSRRHRPDIDVSCDTIVWFYSYKNKISRTLYHLFVVNAVLLFALSVTYFWYNYLELCIVPVSELNLFFVLISNHSVLSQMEHIDSDLSSGKSSCTLISFSSIYIYWFHQVSTSALKQFRRYSHSRPFYVFTILFIPSLFTPLVPTTFYIIKIPHLISSFYLILLRLPFFLCFFSYFMHVLSFSLLIAVFNIPSPTISSPYINTFCALSFVSFK